MRNHARLFSIIAVIFLAAWSTAPVQADDDLRYWKQEQRWPPTYLDSTLSNYRFSTLNPGRLAPSDPIISPARWSDDLRRWEQQRLLSPPSVRWSDDLRRWEQQQRLLSPPSVRLSDDLRRWEQQQRWQQRLLSPPNVRWSDDLRRWEQQQRLLTSTIDQFHARYLDRPFVLMDAESYLSTFALTTGRVGLTLGTRPIMAGLDLAGLGGEGFISGTTIGRAAVGLGEQFLDQQIAGLPGGSLIVDRLAAGDQGIRRMELAVDVYGLGRDLAKASRKNKLPNFPRSYLRKCSPSLPL